MPIAPEHKFGEPQKPRVFIDREHHIGIFTQSLASLPLTDNKLINYYRVGGIGKTALRIELCNLLKEKHDKVAWSVVDFALPDNRSVENALFLMRRDLHHKYKIQFPCFDIAYAWYWQVVHPQTTLKKEQPFFLEESSLIADVVSLIGDVPVVQWAPKIINYTSKGYSRFREWWTKRGVPELQQLQSMETIQIIDWLPAFFGHDLADFINEKGAQMVLFLDSYEALWTDIRGEGQSFRRDKWVRELSKHLPEVLWVILGREKLRWKEVNPAWESHIEPYLIGDLSDPDANDYLVSCGIKEEAIRNAIVRGSKGVPLYLAIQADTYSAIEGSRETVPTPEDFAKTPQEVINTFIRYLDISETETIRILSIPRFWDRKLFELLIEHFKTGYPPSALQQLCRFSFVQESQVPQSWTLHMLMREGLSDGIDELTFQQVHQFLFDYYCQHLESVEQQNISEIHRLSFMEAFYHGQHALDTDKFFEWFYGLFSIFYQAAMWQILKPMQEEFVNLNEAKLGLSTPIPQTA